MALTKKDLETLEHLGDDMTDALLDLAKCRREGQAGAESELADLAEVAIPQLLRSILRLARIANSYEQAKK